MRSSRPAAGVVDESARISTDGKGRGYASAVRGAGELSPEEASAARCASPSNLPAASAVRGPGSRGRSPRNASLPHTRPRTDDGFSGSSRKRELSTEDDEAARTVRSAALRDFERSELQRQLRDARAQSAHFAEHGRGYGRRIEELEGMLQDLQQRHDYLSERSLELLAPGQQ